MLEALLTANDPPPFEVLNLKGTSPCLLVVDHAGQAIPEKLGDLGLSEADRQRHIFYDLGIEGVARGLSDLLDAPAILSTYSRLVVDLNRLPDYCMPPLSDGTEVPANQGQALSQYQAQRLDEIFWPYHRQVDTLIQNHADGSPIVIFLHSMTDQLRVNPQPRPWDTAVLWAKDDRFAKIVLPHLQCQSDWCVGENQPYTGDDIVTSSIQWHGVARGLFHIGLEIRQDHLTTPDQQYTWASRLAPLFQTAFFEAQV